DSLFNELIKGHSVYLEGQQGQIEFLIDSTLKMVFQGFLVPVDISLVAFKFREVSREVLVALTKSMKTFFGCNATVEIFKDVIKNLGKVGKGGETDGVIF